MYIWRGKNRRDKRNHLIFGEKFWTVGSDDIFQDEEDEAIRCEGEEKHIKYFTDRVKKVVQDYLEAPEGRIEIDLLAEAIRKKREKDYNFVAEDTLFENEFINLKENLYEIFKKFALSDELSIDKKGLMNLVSDLKIKFTKKEFEQYATDLDLNGKNAVIYFDEFFEKFLNDMKHPKKKTWSSFFTKKIGSKNAFNLNISSHIRQRLRENEAKLLLVEYSVEIARKNVTIEYRKSHPPAYHCEECDNVFPSDEDYKVHQKDIKFHTDFLKKKFQDEEKFKVIMSIFTGEQGRKLQANRLLFSKDLDTMESRITAAIAEPFRPYLADKESKRRKQLIRGMYVQGFDAKTGIRPIFRKNNLASQHLVPLRMANNANSIIPKLHPMLQEVVNDLILCRDNFIDTTSTLDHPKNSKKFDSSFPETESLTQNKVSHPYGLLAQVKFQWNEFVEAKVFIIGEFNGWSPEEMVCDIKTGRFFILKQLSPGRYKYRFLIDGKERVDAQATQVKDINGVLSNEILITNTPIFNVENIDHKTKTLKELSNKLKKKSIFSNGDDSSEMDDISALDDDFEDLSPMELEEQNKFGRSRPSTEYRQIHSTYLQENFKRSADHYDIENKTTSSHSHTRSSIGDLYSKEIEEGEIMHISALDKSGLIRRLEHIELRNMSLYDDGVWALASYVNKNNFIKMVDLSYNSISDEGIQALSGCLPLLLALEELKLNGNGFGVDGCRYLFANLKQIDRLTRLELSNNRIGDDGVDIICDYLKYNEHLKLLYIDACYVGDDGAEALGQMLLNNRTLELISLVSNNIKFNGIEKLGKGLNLNAQLKHLKLSNNPLGPNGARAIGDFLCSNCALLSLDIDGIKLLEGSTTFGLHGLCFGLKSNKHLTHLSIKNNSLENIHLVDLAHAMTFNKQLVVIDLTGSKFDKHWLDPEAFIPTHILPEMPSIAMTLAKNIKLAKEMTNAHFDEINRIVDDVPKGRWTIRKQWKRVVKTESERNDSRQILAKEYARIEQEKQFIKTELAKYMNSIKFYLSEKACKGYIRVVCKLISHYIYNLSKFHPGDYGFSSNFGLSERGVSIKGLNVREQSIKLHRAMSSKSFRRPMSTKSHRTITPELNVQKDLVSPINLDSFMNAHISVINTLFIQLNENGDRHSMTINPNMVEFAMQILALPLRAEEVQKAVDETLVPVRYKIGLNKFSDYVLRNSSRISKENKFQRLRLLADLFIHPPIDEAKSIILDCIQHAAINELREKYRFIPENAPLFSCSVCHKRFVTQSLLDKHKRKGLRHPEHRRLDIKNMIFRSQVLFLQQAKWVLTGVYFPAYYELAPSYLLPQDYYAQIFDNIGKQGRPIGVIEQDRTIRAIDAFGDYLHVSYNGVLGWVKYKDSWHVYLQLIGAGIEGFDWNEIHIQESSTYYRFNDILNDEIEIKVRYQPYLKSEVLGYIGKNEVVECFAVVGDWLQIRYKKEETAWVLWKKASKGFENFNKNVLHHESTTENKKNHKVISPFIEDSEYNDHLYDDHIVSYEINKKKYRVNLKKNKDITRHKINEFNKIRYGYYYGDEESSDSKLTTLILLPKYLQHWIQSKAEFQHKSPISIDQNMIFEFLKSVTDEDTKQNFNSFEEEFDRKLRNNINRFGVSSKDDVFRIQEDDEDEFDETGFDSFSPMNLEDFKF